MIHLKTRWSSSRPTPWPNTGDSIKLVKSMIQSKMLTNLTDFLMFDFGSHLSEDTMFWLQKRMSNILKICVLVTK